MKHLRKQKAFIPSSREHLFKEVTSFTRGHKTYYYFRASKHSKKQYFKSEPGTEAFILEYNKFLRIGVKAKKKKQTFDELIFVYKASSEFTDLAKNTRALKHRVMDFIRSYIGPHNVADMNKAHCDALINKKSAPSEANKVRKELSVLFNFAQSLEWIPQSKNPAKLTKKRNVNSKGFHTWTHEEVEAFEACHQAGSEARLALYLMMCTGAARSDVVKLGWGNVKNNKIYFDRQKTDESKASRIPSFLMEELKHIPRDQDTFLITAYGKAYMSDGFGNKFKKWATKAGIPHCTSHGLRSAMAVKLAHLGATDQMIAAWLAHNGTGEVRTYTKNVEREKLVESSMQLLGWR